jgi:predicted enzyme related to lactoylglutathione lyase
LRASFGRNEPAVSGRQHVFHPVWKEDTESKKAGLANYLQPQPEEVAMGNPFVHVELMSTDVPKSKAFYGSLFDWDLEDVAMPEMMYTMIKVGEGTGGGMLKNPIPGAPSSWIAYVNVDDVRASTAKAKTLGAKVMKDVTEVPDMGWFSMITDPTGAMLALWESKSR